MKQNTVHKINKTELFFIFNKNNSLIPLPQNQNSELLKNI